MTDAQYRVFQKSVKGTRNLYNVNKIMDVAATNIEKDPDSDYYESIYIYNEAGYKQLKETKSLAGIRDIKTDRLVWDFDSKDLDEALRDTNDLVDRLLTYFPAKNIRVFFSGNKGNHVEVHLNETLTRSQFEKIVFGLAEGLSTFDERIKDEQRLFRFPLTKNTKSGLFKIPLKLDELSLSVEEIKGLASDTGIDFDLRMGLLDSYGVESLPQELKELMNTKEVVKDDNRTKDGPASLDVPDMSKRPKHISPAKYALQQGFFEEGERNEACMILASLYKYIGQDADETYSLIRSALRKRANRLGLADGYDKKELWSTIIEPVFSPLWKGGTFSEEDGLLKRTIERFNLDKGVDDVGLVSLHSLADNYKDFAVNIKKNTIALGIDEIDKKVRITTSMFVCLLASPGAGKTSISMGILNSLSKNNEKAIFFSLDMGVPQVYQRLIQRHTGHKSNQITDNYEKNVVGEIEKYQSILTDEYKNVKFCFKGGLTCEQIKETIISEKNKTGVMPKLVVIDYLECIQSQFSDSTQSKAYIATALKNMANELGICVFLLVQPAKVSGDPSNELTSYSQIKGSGVLAEASTIVFTLSRPGFSPKNPDDDNYATINVVKNRMGELSSTDLHWEGLTGNIRTLTSEEENDLKALRKQIAAANKKDEDLY